MEWPLIYLMEFKQHYLTQEEVINKSRGDIRAMRYHPRHKFFDPKKSCIPRYIIVGTNFSHRMNNFLEGITLSALSFR
jgi:hypothetical protein